MDKMAAGNPFKEALKWTKPQEILEPSLKKAKKASFPEKSRWMANKKEEVIGKIKVLAEELVRRLQQLVKAYPSLDDIHEFYRSIVEVWTSTSEVKETLTVAWRAQFKIRNLAGRYIKRIDHMELEGKRGIEKLIQVKKAAYGRICSVVKDLDEELAFLSRITKKLAGLPDYDPSYPAVVVAGPPNSGKSTLIKNVSKAKVEIASYPFTTKKITFGHVDLDINPFVSLRTQIVDTPGLFDRPLDERKKPEILALKAIRHLADAVIILLDGSLTNPLDPEGQKTIYNTVRFFFKKKEYLVTINKLDIGNENVLTSLESFLSENKEDFLKISLKENIHTDLLLEKVGKLLKGTRFLREHPLDKIQD